MYAVERTFELLEARTPRRCTAAPSVTCYCGFQLAVLAGPRHHAGGAAQQDIYDQVTLVPAGHKTGCRRATWPTASTTRLMRSTLRRSTPAAKAAARAISRSTRP